MNPLYGLQPRPRRRLEVISNSRLGAREVCRRYHHLRYTAGLHVAREAEALRFGTLVHLFLWRYWCERGEGLVRPGEAEAFNEAVAAAEAEDAFLLAKAVALAAQYAAYWNDQDLEPLDVEAEFYAPLVDPRSGKRSRQWIIGGKIDVIARRRSNGQVVVIEHKTSSENIETGSQYWQRLRMDRQLGMYLIGARALGHDPVETIYDVLATPEQRPYKATPAAKRQYTKAGALYANQRERDESPAEYGARIALAIEADPGAYFVREPIVRTQAQLDEAMAEVCDIAREMRRDEIAGYGPASRKMCFHWHRPCDYFRLCSGDAEPSDPQFKIVSQPHAELAHVPPERS